MIFNNTDNFIPGCCTVFKSELVKYYLPLPEHVSSYDTWLHFVGNFIKKRMVVNKVFQLYRRHEKNNTYAIFNCLTPIGTLKKYQILIKIFLNTIFNRKKILRNNIMNYEVLKKRLILHDKNEYNKKINKCKRALEIFYKREKILNNSFHKRFYEIYLSKVLWFSNGLPRIS